MISRKSGAPKLNVLVAYSGADSRFAVQLIEGLQSDGQFNVSVTSDSATKDDNWKTSVGDLIAKADSIVFVLTPEVASSEISSWLLEYAGELETRVIPVVDRSLGNALLPSKLNARNFVRFDTARSFPEGLKSLITALTADSEWLRQHTRLFARARGWEDAGRPEKKLLTADEVAEAKAWTFDRPINAPKPTDLHMTYISASESLHTSVRVAEQKQEGTRTEAGAVQQMAPVKKPYWRRASRVYDALIGSLLLLVAAGAGWQAIQAKKQVAGADKMIAEANKQAAEATEQIALANEKAMAQQKIAEQATAALAAQSQRMGAAFTAVAADLCNEAMTITNVLSTTGDQATWDSNFNLFWSLHAVSMIQQKNFEGALSDQEPEAVKTALAEFGDKLGKRGEVSQALEPVLPRLSLLIPAQNVSQACIKLADTQ